MSPIESTESKSVTRTARATMLATVRLKIRRRILAPGADRKAMLTNATFETAK
jgi:hypothetical protein